MKFKNIIDAREYLDNAPIGTIIKGKYSGCNMIIIGMSKTAKLGDHSPLVDYGPSYAYINATNNSVKNSVMRRFFGWKISSNDREMNEFYKKGIGKFNCGITLGRYIGDEYDENGKNMNHNLFTNMYTIDRNIGLLKIL